MGQEAYPSCCITGLRAGYWRGGSSRLQDAELLRLRQAWASSPHDADVGYRLGAALFEAGAFDEAGQVLSSAAETTLDPDRLVMIARSLEALSAVEAATFAYRRAIDCDPLHVEAHGFMAALIVRQDGLPGAQDALRKWASLSEDPIDAHFQLASLLSEEGALGQAADHLQIALDLDPKHAAAQELLGIVLGKRGDHAGAVEAWRAARRLEPSSAQTAAGLGMALCRAGAHAEAISLLAKGVTGSAELCCLGRSLRETGQTGQALEALERAVEVDDDSGEAHAELGWTAFVMKEYDRATRELRRAAELSPRSGQVHHQLGRVLIAADQRRQALAALLKAAALLPKDEAVQADLRALQDELRGAKSRGPEQDDVEMTGQLDIVTLPNLLEFFTNNGTSGELLITAQDREAFVFLQQGRILAAHATGCAGLGAALAESGDISQGLVQQVLADLEEDHVAEAAYTQGLVSEDRLRAGMEHQIVQVLLKAVTWRGASFRFRRDSQPLREVGGVHALDTRFALMEVMRLLDEAGAPHE